MQNIELIRILRTLSKAEIKESRDFISSPFFNKNKNVTKLFSELVKYHPEYSTSSLKKIKVFKKLYPGEKYNEKRLNLLIHYLNKVLNNYVAYKHHFQNDFNYSYDIVEAKSSRTSNSDIKKDIDRLIAAEKKKGPVAEDNYYNSFMLNKLMLSIKQTSDRKAFGKATKIFELDSLFGSLTSFYLLNFFKLFIIAMNRNSIYFSKYQIEDITKQFLNLNRDTIEKDNLLKIYYLICMLHVKEESQGVYAEIKKLMYESKDSFEIDDRILIYNQMRNYCIRKSWIGDFKFDEQFLIIKEQIADKPLLEKIFTSLFYINTIKCALKLDLHEWTYSFIEEYKEKLPESSRKNIYSLGMSLYYYRVMKPEESLKYIKDFMSDNRFLVYDVKVVESWIYYDLNWDERLYSHIESFRQYIKADKVVTEERKKTMNIYLKYLFKLLKFKENVYKNGNKERIITYNKLKEEINADVILSKNWLLERLQKLEASELQISS